jgi:hypothetical protein
MRSDQRERLSLGKYASRWTPGDPFRPDKFGNRIAILIDQIIHVSSSRKER